MSRRFRDQNNDCKVYVGDLGSSASKQDLEEAFSYYGRLRNVWVARNPPGFAFVEFEDPRDAQDSCRGLDRSMLNGHRMRVELSRINPKRSRGPPQSRGRTFNPDDRCYECGDKGHYARDCPKPGSGGGGGGGKSSGYKGRRSPSRSPSRGGNSRSRSRSRSPFQKNGGSPSRSRSYSRSRSRSPNKRIQADEY